MGRQSMVNLNGNLLCAVDVETTGLRPRYHDIIQVCVMPLNADLEMLGKTIPGVKPFYAEMKAKRPENVDVKAMEVTKLDFLRIMTDSLDADRMADLFEEWYEKTIVPIIPVGKNLVPLAHNWLHDHGFMEDWLGYDHMEYYFHGHYRDTMVMAAFNNDYAEFNVERHPYPRIGLKSLCKTLGVENPNEHDALGDCIAVAGCYKAILHRGLYFGN